MATLDRLLAQAVLRAPLVVGARDLALRQAHRQIECNPRNRHAQATRAHLLAGQGKNLQALADLQRLVELAPEQQPMSPNGWCQLARVHLERGEPEQARRVLRHLHSFEPKVAAQLERETGLRAGSV